MKKGDLVIYNFNPYTNKISGQIGLITDICLTRYGTGQIHIMSSKFNGTIQWAGREKFIRVLDKN